MHLEVARRSSAGVAKPRRLSHNLGLMLPVALCEAALPEGTRDSSSLCCATAFDRRLIA
jgi:hypothetical protein